MALGSNTALRTSRKVPAGETPRMKGQVTVGNL